MIINRNAKESNVFKYDKRKAKKVSPLASCLIEHLTEETNGSITARELKLKLKRILKLDLHVSTIANHRHKYLGKLKISI